MSDVRTKIILFKFAERRHSVCAMCGYRIPRTVKQIWKKELSNDLYVKLLIFLHNVLNDKYSLMLLIKQQK